MNGPMPDDRVSSPGTTDGAPEGPAFLAHSAPPWAARGLVWLLRGVFAATAIAAFVIRVPETVVSRFVLIPMEGVDQIRAPKDGSITEIRAGEARPVAKGEPLLAIRSGAIGDRAAEMRALEIAAAGSAERLQNESHRHESQRRADAEESTRLRSRWTHLGQKLAEHHTLRKTRQARYRAALAIHENDIEIARREIEFKQKQHAVAKELADRIGPYYQQGIISWLEYHNRQLEATKLAAELVQLDRSVDSGRLKVSQVGSEEEQAEIEWKLAVDGLVTERKEIQAAMDKLGHESAARTTAFRELQRGLAEETERGHVRTAALRADLEQSRGYEVVVLSPCAGTVLKLWTKRTGTAVRAGDPLADLACAGSRLQAELTVAPSNVGQLKRGQRVKLLYDAFPYQRYGVRHATVRWMSPATVEGNFRVFADIDDVAVTVKGEARTLNPGMGGRADVMVGRRALATYLVEPLRQLKETLADVPPPAADPEARP